MKKVLVLLSLLLCLSGCAIVKVVNIDDIKEEIDEVISELDSIGFYRTNNTLNYFSYYLPSGMGEEELDSDSIVLKYNNSKIIMNLNISGIINSRYYTNHLLDEEGFFDERYLVYSKEGTYTTKDNNAKAYVLKIYDYNSNYVLHLLTRDNNFYGTTNLSDVVSVVRNLFVIAKNTSVSTESLIKAFSNKDIIDYQKKQINLFDVILPANGELSQMLIDDAVIGDNSDKEVFEEPEEEVIEEPVEEPAEEANDEVIEE